MDSKIVIGSTLLSFDDYFFSVFRNENWTITKFNIKIINTKMIRIAYKRNLIALAF